MDRKFLKKRTPGESPNLRYSGLAGMETQRGVNTNFLVMWAHHTWINLPHRGAHSWRSWAYRFNSSLLIPLTAIIHCQSRIKLSDLQLFYTRKWASTWILQLFEAWALGSHYWLICLNSPQPPCVKYLQIFHFIQRVITSKRAKRSWVFSTIWRFLGASSVLEMTVALSFTIHFHLLLVDSSFKKSFSGTQTSKWSCFNLHDDRIIGLYSFLDYCINQLDIIHECK